MKTICHFKACGTITKHENFEREKPVTFVTIVTTLKIIVKTKKRGVTAQAQPLQKLQMLLNSSSLLQMLRTLHVTRTFSQRPFSALSHFQLSTLNF